MTTPEKREGDVLLSRTALSGVGGLKAGSSAGEDAASKGVVGPEELSIQGARQMQKGIGTLRERSVQICGWRNSLSLFQIR